MSLIHFSLISLQPMRMSVNIWWLLPSAASSFWLFFWLSICFVIILEKNLKWAWIAYLKELEYHLENIVWTETCIVLDVFIIISEAFNTNGSIYDSLFENWKFFEQNWQRIQVEISLCHNRTWIRSGVNDHSWFDWYSSWLQTLSTKLRSIGVLFRSSIFNKRSRREMKTTH